MSASPLSRKISEVCDIPARRILVNDASQLPSDYCTTPGGTIFSTTPGGTRIIYDRNFLLQMRNSPVAKTPPKNLPKIPGVTSPAVPKQKEKADKNVLKKPIDDKKNENKEKPEPGDEPQFEMDI